MSNPDEMVECRVTSRVRAFNGCSPGEEVILSRAAATEHERRGRVVILGELTPDDASEEE